MGMLLVLYHVCLSREKIHQFNRFYLLFSIIISLVIPFITIPVYVEINTPLPATPVNMAQPVANNTLADVSSTNYILIALWSLYIGIATLLLCKFIGNLLYFIKKIRLGKVINHNSYKNIKLVLMPKPTLPYTFLNYIFINEEEYNQQTIEDELLTHELTHAQEKHSIDILFIELLKVIFWINPLLYLYANSIRLNHEFLADAKVVSKTQSVSGYQKMLIEKASGIAPAFASTLNFSLTKKRLLMMTKTTSRTKAITLKAIAVPVIAALVSLLSTKELIAQNKNITLKNLQKVEVIKLSTKEIDSLRKVNPEKYGRAIESDFYATKNTYMDDSGKTTIVTEINLKSEVEKQYKNLNMENKNSKNLPQKNYIGMSMESITQFQIDSLKKIDPVKYKDVNKEYFYVKKRSKDKNGKTVTERSFNKLSDLYNKEREVDTATNIVDGTQYTKVTQKNSYRQEPEYTPEDLTKEPEYSEGGLAGFYNYVNRNFKIPEIKEDLTTKIYVSFVIEKDGTMSNIKVLKNPGHGLGEEAIRVFKTIPEKWTPGEIDSKPVRCSYTLPITINIRV